MDDMREKLMRSRQQWMAERNFEKSLQSLEIEEDKKPEKDLLIEVTKKMQAKFEEKLIEQKAIPKIQKQIAETKLNSEIESNTCHHFNIRCSLLRTDGSSHLLAHFAFPLWTHILQKLCPRQKQALEMSLLS